MEYWCIGPEETKRSFLLRLTNTPELQYSITPFPRHKSVSVKTLMSCLLWIFWLVSQNLLL